MRRLARHWALAAAVVLCVLHFASFNATGQPLVTDIRYWVYDAWRMTEGAVPHLDLFENKTALAAYVGALFYAAGDLTGLDPLLAIRCGYLAIAAAGGVLAFAVFRRLADGDNVAGLLGTIAYCAFGLTGVLAATGNIPKLIMTIAAPAAALLAFRSRWFWAGLAGGLAFMDWQIGALVWLGAAAAAAVYGAPRARAITLVAAGGAAGVAPFAIYYAMRGALAEAVRQVVILSIAGGLEREPGVSFTNRLVTIRTLINLACPAQQWLFVAGLAGAAVVGWWMWVRRRADLGRLLLPLVVYHGGIAVFSLIDFQFYGDFLALVLTVAFFLGALWTAIYREVAWLAAGARGRAVAGTVAVLAAVAMARPGPLRPSIELVNPTAAPGATLDDQKEVAAAIAERLGDGRIAVLRHSEILFLMRRANALPVFFWNPITQARYRREGESGPDTALRLLLSADAKLVVPPESMGFEAPRALGFEIETFRSSSGRYAVTAAARPGAPAAASAGGDGSGLPDPREIDRLRSLGYVGVGAPLAPDAKTGVLVYDRDRAAAGVTLITNSHFCSAQLIDMDGLLLHEWSYDPCYRWGNAVLLPSGDLVVMGREPHEESLAAARRSRYLLRLNWDGEIVWRKKIVAHHDVDAGPDGDLLALTYTHRIIPAVNPTIPVREHFLVHLSASGDVLETVPLWDLLRSAPDAFAFNRVTPRFFEGGMEVDLFHTNTVVRKQHPRIPGDLLLCLRNQDSIVIADWEQKRVVWSWGRGELSAPHDASMLDNGNILVFDNGMGRNWSRVVELDPVARAIVWEYRAEDPTSFYSFVRGSNQRLSNGNTLITESETGRVFEVTPEGEIVWEFLNPNLTENREPSVIVRARRFEGMDYETMLGIVESGGALPKVD